MDLTTLATDRIPQDGLEDQAQRVVAAVYRLLARGRPVAPQRAAAHAGASVADVEKVLDEWGGHAETRPVA